MSVSHVKFMEDNFQVDLTALQGIVKDYEGTQKKHISRNQKQTRVGLFLSNLSIGHIQMLTVLVVMSNLERYI